MYIVVGDEEEVFIDLKYKDIQNYDISNYGKIRVKKTGKCLKPFIDKDGYEKVTLYNKKKRYTVSVHRLVAINFLDEPEKEIVNHKDTNRRNNFYKNLEWCSQQENIHHSINHGSFDKHRLKRTVNKNYTEDLIHQICMYISEGKTSKEIIDLIEIIPRKKMISLIHDLKKRKSWTHISKLYF